MTTNYLHIKIILFVSILTTIVSCKKEIVYQWPSGNISGSVALSSASSDNSGVLVTIEGASLKTVTNANGEFSFENVPTGIYDIVFTKDGFGTNKLVSLQFIGGSEPLLLRKTTLYKLPVTTISITTTDNQNLEGNLTGDDCDLQYYISDQPDVSYKNYLFTGEFWVMGDKHFNFNLLDWTFPKSCKGKLLYFILYPKVYSSSGSYIDINTGCWVFPGVNPGYGWGPISFYYSD